MENRLAHRASVLEQGLALSLDLIRQQVSTTQMPIIVAIAGGSGSGKTSIIAARLMENLGDTAILISADRYYRDQSTAFTACNGQGINTDTPDAFDMDLLAGHIEVLKRGGSIDVPVYDYRTCSRLQHTDVIVPGRVVVIEGLYVLRDEFAPLYDVRIFLRSSAEVRLRRKLLRDAGRTGRDEDSIRRYFTDVVSPMHDLYVEPTVVNADIVISND